MYVQYFMVRPAHPDFMYEKLIILHVCLTFPAKNNLKLKRYSQTLK